MTENGSAGDSVFLRAWDDYENTTIKLTAHPQPGIGRTNFRASSPEALQRRVAADRGDRAAAGGWQDGDPGYGPVYVFTDPDGHEMGSTTRPSGTSRTATLQAGAEEPGPGLPGRGVSVRRIDHINYLAVDPGRRTATSSCDALGAMVTEQIVLDDGTIAGSWMTFTNKGYDVV